VLAVVAVAVEVVVEVVVLGAVWLVGLVTGGVAVVVPAAPVLEVAAEPPAELPHAASSRAIGSRSRRFTGRAVLGSADDACHYPDQHGP
jgi:hypothetical protein